MQLFSLIVLKTLSDTYTLVVCIIYSVFSLFEKVEFRLHKIYIYSDMCMHIYIYIYREREREKKCSVCKYGLWGMVIWQTFSNIMYKIVKMCMFVIWKDIHSFRMLNTLVSRVITTVNLFSISFRYSVKIFHNFL
jgi:hypothetical protein